MELTYHSSNSLVLLNNGEKFDLINNIIVSILPPFKTSICHVEFNRKSSFHFKVGSLLTIYVNKA